MPLNFPVGRPSEKRAEMKAEFRKYVDDDGTERFKFAGVTDGVVICPHLGVLPDGTRPTYRFVDLGDGKTGAMPDRLYVEVHTDDGRTVIIDATTTEAGIPEVHSVTITRTDTEVELSWGANPGQSFRVQFQDNLQGENWQDITTPIVAKDTTATITFSTELASRRFYRVTIPLN